MMTEREGRKRSNDEMRRLEKKNYKKEKYKRGESLKRFVESDGRNQAGKGKKKGYLIKLRKKGKRKKGSGLVNVREKTKVGSTKRSTPKGPPDLREE